MSLSYMQPFVFVVDIFQHIVLIVLFGAIFYKLSIIWIASDMRLELLRFSAGRTVTQERAFELAKILMIIGLMPGVIIGWYFFSAFGADWYLAIVWVMIIVMMLTLYAPSRILGSRVWKMYVLTGIIFALHMSFSIIALFEEHQKAFMLMAPCFTLLETSVMYVLIVSMLINIDVGTLNYGSDTVCSDDSCFYPPVPR
jgi:hypothetical protein